MVPATGPWALIGQSASYLIKLAPLLWWALPSSQKSKLAAKANRPSPETQYPDTAQEPCSASHPGSHCCELVCGIFMSGTYYVPQESQQLASITSLPKDIDPFLTLDRSL
ncbi:hypothetical protein DSO57_1000814 [Entomophthora muscae]|uniref:Uncharacterized protein n=1 Tax=Entomophthora muscae TaxID=34485 RepID=A0ACC2U7P8_9FUNG|nr:hypothetical protein DSO57_1000814 [Entomophthora muscae]